IWLGPTGAMLSFRFKDFDVIVQASVNSTVPCHSKAVCGNDDSRVRGFSGRVEDANRFISGDVNPVIRSNGDGVDVLESCWNGFDFSVLDQLWIHFAQRGYV